MIKTTFSLRRFYFLLVLVSAVMLFLATQLVWSKPLPVEIQQWNTTAALPEGVASRNAVVHGDFVYLVGGKNASENPIATIYGARIRADGGLENWTVAGQLPLPLYLHAAVVADDALFVIGGWDGKTTRAEVWRAAFTNDGKVGAWTPMPAYPIAVDLHDATVLNGRIYVVGGWDGVQALGGVYAARIEGSSLGPWQRVGDLPQTLYRLAIATDTQRLFVTGGYGANGVASAAVYVTGVTSDGVLSGWQSYSLPTALYYHKAVVHDGRLVVLGGRNDTQTFAQVYAAPIAANGALGGWQNAPALPVAVYRMGAVTINRYGSDYIFVVGGARSETEYQTAVYHSSAPLPPTPTATPTLTPTPTPPPTLAVTLQLRSEPPHWIAPGGEITYFITYQNGSAQALSNVTISNRIPAQVALIANSIRTSQGVSSTTGSQPGALITWEIGTVAGGTTGQVSYQVQRPLPPTPSVPPALTLNGEAPNTVNKGSQITYNFTLANHSPAPLSNLLLTDTLPVGATYVSGGDGPPTNNIVRWSVPTLPADSSLTLQLVVTAEASLVNSDYRVTAQEGPTARGRTTLVTLVDGQPPFYGDGVIIVNNGATITWTNQGQTTTAETRTVYNPSFSLYLPLVQR